MIREKEAIERQEKLAAVTEEQTETSTGMITGAQDFQRRFIAGQAKTLLNSGKLTPGADRDKAATRGRQDDLHATVKNIYDIFDKQAGDTAENLREADKEKKSGGMLRAVGSAAAGGAKAVAKGASGFFSKLLTGIGGITGVGSGALMAGLGVLAGGGAFLLSELGDMDAKGIRANVKELMGIETDNGGTTLSFLGKGGGFAIAMAAIGAGVALFSIGAGVAAAIGYFTEDSKWSEVLVKNVDTLMSMNTGFVENASFLAEGVGFGASMAMIGLGLAAFSAGAVVAQGVGAIGNTVDYFSKTGWSQGIVDNVNILMGMRTGFKENAAFLLESVGFAASMGMIGLGLLAFSAGSAAGIAVHGVDEAIKAFGVTGFAQGIVNNVDTLLGMTNSSVFSTANIAGFTAGMLSIGVGLAAFAIGEGASGVASAITSFSKKGWTEDIKDNVTGLLDMTDDERFGFKRIGEFVTGIAAISGALILFNATKVLDTFVGLGAGVVNFFTGNDSPIAKIEKIGDNADKLTAAGIALAKISTSIVSLNNIKFSADKFRFSEFAADLAEGTNGINTALYGGTWDTTLGWYNLGGKISVKKGLSGMPPIDFRSANTAIMLLQQAIGGINGDTANSTPSRSRDFPQAAGGDTNYNSFITVSEEVRFKPGGRAGFGARTQ
jgi:hypothetical protein